MEPKTRATSSDIRDHYDRLSHLYHRWWGEHIHHGYWEGGENQVEAQIKLIERLTARAAIFPGDHVLDIGCGIGGSSIWLAKQLDCQVTGITISPVQTAIATKNAQSAGLSNRVTFVVADANDLHFPKESFDAIWSIECIEHLHRKKEVFSRSARMLRKGGKLAICTWLAAENLPPKQNRLIEKICHGMLCPSLESMNMHVEWMRSAGFEQICAEDITDKVAPTWKRCSKIIRQPELQWLLRLTDQRTRDFANTFSTMTEAYAEKAMLYGMFTARMKKP